MLRVLWPLMIVAFTIYNLVDCIQTKDADVRNLPKILWILLILLFPLVGGFAWLLAGRSATPTPGIRPPLRRSGPAPRGPRGPDDDPDFLGKL